VAAGLMGMPGYHAAAWLAAALASLGGDDDERFDLTHELRKMIGNEQLANVIMRGTPTLAGVDVSHRIGAGTMLSAMPYSSADLSTPKGQFEAAGTLLGGASLGMGIRMADGLGQMLSGEWLRGAELVLPKGLGDAIKGARFGSEGMTRRNGDVLLSADEISTVEAMMVAIGMSPIQASTMYERRNHIFKMDQHFKERTTTLKNQYAKAARAQDRAAMREVIEDWGRLQEARTRHGYSRQPYSTLIKAPMEQMKRERETIAGLQTSRSNRELAATLSQI
jgi:hypothetical protein